MRHNDYKWCFNSQHLAGRKWCATRTLLYRVYEWCKLIPMPAYCKGCCQCAAAQLITQQPAAAGENSLVSQNANPLVAY